MEKKSGAGLTRIRNAFGWSMAGLAATLKHEKAFQQELGLCLVLAPFGLWLGETGVEKGLLLGTLFLVLIVEILNSAIEAVVDRFGGEHHALSGRAKDMGSAAVFLALANVGVVWILVLFF
ncbi:diacylglycerol kinase [Thiovibrio frasassiensis]|uniref:Diacylglycerol kinase n=1 Tax=Thiovibrio frasassiensis TaxID=2984131 RepID=A0A9X4MEI6_9BACT|nr:diacylglycerol kinase [Thiovibrio frasassiensis]MDG4474645.1 diacylglycerol kinase [Thiovibrio frasassiensis]